MQQSTGYPLVHPLRPVGLGAELRQMVQGNGIYLQDEEGRTFIDGISGLWNVSLGYGHPVIKQAIVNQLEMLPFVNLAENNNPTTLEFAKRLLQLMPEGYFQKVIFTCTGSESVELSIKIARKFYQVLGKPNKNKFAVLDLSYHGTYYGAMSASGIDQELSKDYGPKVPGFHFVPAPVCTCCSTEDVSENCLQDKLDALEALFLEQGQELAGVILEPVIGSGGIIPLPKSYLERVSKLCRQHDVLLIFDEVATGFGRTGKWFAFEHYGVVPDLICLSKGINSGYLPLGALIMSGRLDETFQAAQCHIEHLSTQNGNPIACASGLATLDVIANENLCEHAESVGNHLRKELENAIGGHKNVSEVRGKGLMIGIELVKSKKSGEILTVDQVIQIANKIKQRGLIVYQWYSEPITCGISLFPPLILTKEESQKIVNTLKQTFGRLMF